MKIAASILGVAAMGGWILHHAVPADVPSARLTLSTGAMTRGSYMIVQAFDNEACDRHPDGTRLAFFGTRRLQGKTDPHDGTDRRVRAGRPIVVSYIYQHGSPGFTPTVRCRNTVSFVPAENARYRIHYEMDAEACMVDVKRTDGGDPAAVDRLHAVEPGCNDIFRG